MSTLPPIEEREDFIPFGAGPGLVYITLIIGYLLSVLTAAHLTPLNFLVFTTLQVCYIVLHWWLIRNDGKSSQGWQLTLVMALLVGITAAVGLLPLIGLQWDWLLFLVTICVFFLLLPLRRAIGAGILLYVLLVVNLGVLYAWHWSEMYSSLLYLLPAFAFVALFSLVVRVLQYQKERAELLLRQLGESNAELEQAHTQLQEYANEVEELAIVRERTRLAREIHDTLGHYLSILNIQLETISKLQERDPARAAVEIIEARRVTAQSMQEVRNAVAALRPTSIATLKRHSPIFANTRRPAKPWCAYATKMMRWNCLCWTMVAALLRVMHSSKGVASGWLGCASVSNCWVARYRMARLSRAGIV